MRVSCCRIAVFVLLLGGLVFCGFCIAGDKAARAKYGASPHSDSGDCSLCHVSSVEALRGWFVFDSTKRKLKDGPVEVCKKCHGLGFGHATGKRPVVNHAELPLSDDGTINCATTCHNMHIRAEDPKQTFYHLRLPFDFLCISCHDT